MTSVAQDIRRTWHSQNSDDAAQRLQRPFPARAPHSPGQQAGCAVYSGWRGPHPARCTHGMRGTQCVLEQCVAPALAAAALPGARGLRKRETKHAADAFPNKRASLTPVRAITKERFVPLPPPHPWWRPRASELQVTTPWTRRRRQARSMCTGRTAPRMAQQGRVVRSIPAPGHSPHGAVSSALGRRQRRGSGCLQHASPQLPAPTGATPAARKPVSARRRAAPQAALHRAARDASHRRGWRA